MNYDTITAFTFTATAATERFCNTYVKPHWLNASTYALIIAVIVLTSVKAVLDFIATPIDRAPEYRLQLQLFKIHTQRRALAVVISVAEFAAYNGIDHRAVALWGNRGRYVTQAMDRAFGLA